MSVDRKLFCYNAFVYSARVYNHIYDRYYPCYESPGECELWHSVLIEYWRNEIRFTSMARREIVWRLVLDDGTDNISKHSVTTVFFKYLAEARRIRRAVWKFYACPGNLLVFDVRLLIRTFFLLTEYDGQLELEIYPDCENDILHLMKYPEMLCDFRITLHQGDFSSQGLAFDIIKELNARCESNDCLPRMKLCIEVETIAPEGREELVKMGTAVESITIERLSESQVIEQVVRFVQETNSYIEININRFEIPGESCINLPRGNISVAIGSVSSESTVTLICGEELKCLTLTPDAMERVFGPRLRINQIRHKGQEGIALREMVGRFQSVGEVYEVLMAPRLGMMQGHHVWTQKRTDAW